MAILVFQDGLEALPAVEVEVLLEQMIEATIPTDLELRTDSETGTRLLGLDNTLDDPCI